MDKIERYKKLLSYIRDKDFDNAKNYLDIEVINGFNCLNRTTPLYKSIQSRNYKMVEYLLKNGANPNIAIYTCGVGFADFKEPAKINYKYTTYLSYAIAKEGEIYSQGFEEEPRMESIELLIKYGADINAFNQKYDTPLDVAKDNFHYLAEKYLISLGAKTSEEL